MYLSEIKTKDVVLKANKEDIEKIVFEKNNITITERCDIGFVFGGISMIPYRINRGIDLYKSGLINKILVSGGIGFLNTDRKTPEAYKLRDYLIKHDIPKNDIIVEPNSRDTIENIDNALKLLSELYNLDKTTFALITSDFHLRRCLGLFSKKINNERLFGSGVRDGKTDINSWQNSLYAKRLILTEAILLSRYAKNNKIPDQEIKELTLKRKR